MGGLAIQALVQCVLSVMETEREVLGAFTQRFSFRTESLPSSIPRIAGMVATLDGTVTYIPT